MLSEGTRDALMKVVAADAGTARSESAHRGRLMCGAIGNSLGNINAMSYRFDPGIDGRYYHDARIYS